MPERWSRRRFLRASAATVAVTAAAGVIGCGEGKRPTASTPAPTATPSRSPVMTRGGILRAYNFDAMTYDTLDPHQTQTTPVVDLHSAVFSKLLQYDDEVDGTLRPDLADGMPEQPDGLTYIIRLRPGVKFHDAPKYRLMYPGAAGRELTASDVKYSIERQTNANSPKARRFFRRGNWSAIDRIEVPDERTVVIRMKSPVAPFLAFLAGRNSFVVPSEIVGTGDEITGDLTMIGSGPFMLESLEPAVAVKLRRNPDWFARDDNPGGIGTGRPFIDGYDAFFSPQEDLFQEVAIDRRWVDTTVFQDPASLAGAHATNLADVVREETDAGSFLVSRFLLDRAPFQDDRVRRAIHLAVDRTALAEVVYPPMEGAPSARLSGPIAPVMERWATGEEDLLRRPGYRAAEGRDEDIATAKQLWSAALGDAQIGQLPIYVAGVPKTVPERALPALQFQLKQTLGVDLLPSVDPSGVALVSSGLGRNLDGASDGVVPFTLALEDGGVDLDDWLYPYFHSTGAHNTFRLQDATLDAMLEALRTAFDEEARREIGLDIQDYLVANVNARLEYAAPVDRRLTWGYVKNSHHPIAPGSKSRLADTWLDSTHPAWAGRKA